jgi:hypothetical protein
MALPKVTPGTYNYGEYANPTPIRYRGGEQAIGAAIGQGLATAGQIIGQNIKQKKQEAKKDKAILDKVISDTYSRSSKEARESNSEEVMKFANEAGQLALDYKNEIISREEYLKKSTAIQDGLEALNAMQDLSKTIDLEGITPSMLKNNQSFENYLLQKSIEGGSAKRIWDGDQWVIEYNGLDTNKIDPAAVKELNGIPEDAYVTRRVPVSEIADNPKNFFDIQTKIDFNNDSMVDLFSKTAKVFDQQMGDMYKTGVKNGYQVLDEEAAADAFAESAQVNAIYQKIGKDVAEDILEQEFTGSEEQEAEIKKAISQQIIGYAEKQGNKAPVERPQKMVDPVEERTGMNLQDRVNAYNQAVSTPAGEVFEIRFKGTNDFQKENYEIIKSPDNKQLLFRKKAKKGEEPADYQEISMEDFQKEFGLQGLNNNQTPSAKDLINKYSK